MSSLEFLQIEPTTRCNFTCGFCCGRSMPQRDLDFERFEHILERLPDLRYIELQGEGEPLLHPRFFDMVDHARSRGIEVSFITNGSLLSDTAVDRILTAGVEKISISLESADPEVFRQIRGGKLDKVCRRVSALLRERERRGLERPVVGFSVTVLRRTRGSLPGIFALYRALGLDGGITLQPLQAMESYTQIYDEELRAQSLSESEVESLWLRFFADPALRRIEKEKSQTSGFYGHLMQGWRPAQKRCPWLERGLYVDTQGQVTPCCMIKDHARHGLGTLPSDTLEDIRAAKEPLRQGLQKGDLPEPCRCCELGKLATKRPWHLLEFMWRGLKQRIFPPPPLAEDEGALHQIGLPR